MNTKLLSAVQPIPGPLSTRPATISFWRLGEQITGGRHFEIFRAAPKSSTADHSAYDYTIKLVNPSLSADQSAEALQRLGREAAAIDSIQHQGIVPLLDAELDQPDFFLVQPWIAGGTLDQFLAAANDVSLVRCLWIFRQIAEAVVAAHETGRVYFGTDLEHVLMGTGGRIMLTGWSYSHTESHPMQLPCDDFRFARYAAPECFLPGKLAQTASDVFSLGSLIHRVLCNVFPFPGRAAGALAYNDRKKRPIEIIRTQPVCPAMLSILVSEMMATQPGDRPTSREVLNQLIAIEIDNLENPGLIPL